jgi:hypothetical protein
VPGDTHFHLAVENVVEDSLDEVGVPQLIKRSTGRHVHVAKIHFLRDQLVGFDGFENMAMQCLLFHASPRLKLLPK